MRGERIIEVVLFVTFKEVSVKRDRKYEQKRLRLKIT